MMEKNTKIDFGHVMVDVWSFNLYPSLSARLYSLFQYKDVVFSVKGFSL